jgi:chemotaxis protein CheD
MALVTVLGSCISACVHDRTLGIGGMNHFMLPDDKRDGGDILGPSTRYGTYAMEIMLNELLKMGAKRSNLEAKVFGGGNVLRGFTVSRIGEANADFVVEYLNKEGITVAAQDLLDIYPRKVYYFPRSGRVLVKQLRCVHNDTIIEREQAYRARLKLARIQGDVELF